MIPSHKLHHLRQFWIGVSSSLWFVPLGMVFCAIALAVVLIAIDLAIGTDWIVEDSLVFGVGASGARGMLSAIAGSMMTVASLTFSLTISTLATASSQYTSRLIRNFMRDRLNQFVLGYFVGLFAYCLVVLRTIRSGDEASFVPALAVMGGLLLALVSIGVLIFFIHHIADSIQVGSILRRVTDDTLKAINKLFPAELGEPANSAGAGTEETAGELDYVPGGVALDRCHWLAVPAQRYGYVQSLDAEALLALAVERNSVVRMTADIGAFVTPEGTLCEIASSLPLKDDDIAELRDAFSIGAARTIEQDAAFGIRQIVDIALRALSPGINDSTTGVMCVDHLGAILETLASRSIPDQLRAKDGTVRLIASGRSFDALTGLCLNQIRQSASGNTAVMLALLRTIESAGKQTSDHARRRILSRHATLILTLAIDSMDCLDDVEPVKSIATRVLSDLDSDRGCPV